MLKRGTDQEGKQYQREVPRSTAQSKGGASPQSVLAASQSVTGDLCAGSGMRDGGDSVPVSARRPTTASQAQPISTFVDSQPGGSSSDSVTRGTRENGELVVSWT